MKLHKFPIWALLISIVYLGTGCRPEVEDAPISVKIGYQALASSWAFYVANERLPGRERSFFEDEGLAVEAVRFESSNAAMEAMLSGIVATDSATTLTVLLNIEESSPGTLKCFGFQMHTTDRFLESFIARKGANIKSFADLKGKKVGVFPGTLNTQITKLLVSPYMDEERDVTILQMPPPVQLQAITQGQVDALISYEPTTTLATVNGVANVVEHSPWAKRIFEPFPVAAYCFTATYLEQQPDTAAKIARAWGRAISFIHENPSEAAMTIPKYTGISPALAPRLNQPEQRTSAEVNRQAFQKLRDLYLKFGTISKSVEISRIFYEPQAVATP